MVDGGNSMYYDEIREVLIENSGRSEANGPTGWLSAGALIGLVGGLTTGLVGTLLTFTSWFTWAGTLQHYEHLLGTALFFVTIPLLVLGAHCLDLIEKRKQTGRR